MQTLKIYNLTDAKLKFDENAILSKAGFLIPTAKKCSVICVEDDIIDKFYPPYKRVSLDENCLKEILESERMSLNKKLEYLERCNRDFRTDDKFVAVGLFMCQPDFKSIEILEDLLKDKNIKYDYRDLTENVILIAPNRIKKWANKIGVSEKIANLKVVFHEYAHAYICDKKNKFNGQWYEKVIEEGLANFIVLKIFKNNRYKADIHKLILSQPVEYRTCYALDGIVDIYEYIEPYDLYRLDREFFIVLRYYLTRYLKTGKFILTLWKKRYKHDQSNSDKAWKYLALNLLEKTV